MTEPLILEIPIPLCETHRKSHDDCGFIVHTCKNWYYLAIPVRLGSLICRECKNELFIPSPYLRSADLRSADLRSANLRSANLSSADLSSADLSSAYLSSADLCYANLRSANLRSANLRSANLSSADLSSADLSSADLRYADLRSANCLEYAYWNKFTMIDEKFKKLLSKHRFSH